MMGNSASTANELRDLYRELILDHAQSPRNFGKPASVTHDAEGINPLCGDKLHVYLQMNGDCIADISFEGSGCAISMASASLLTEALKGQSEPVARRLFSDLTTALTTDSAPLDESHGKLQSLQGVRAYPSRVKCATLAWHALHAALNRQATSASTE